MNVRSFTRLIVNKIWSIKKERANPWPFLYCFYQRTFLNTMFSHVKNAQYNCNKAFPSTGKGRVVLLRDLSKETGDVMEQNHTRACSTVRSYIYVQIDSCSPREVTEVGTEPLAFPSRGILAFQEVMLFSFYFLFCHLRTLLMH